MGTPENSLLENLEQRGEYSTPFKGSTPLNYEERESLKAEASAVLNSDRPPEIKAWALLHFIEAHYWRAKEHLENNPRCTQRQILGKVFDLGERLHIDTYTHHWLWANGERQDQATVNYLAENFGYNARESKYLPKGMSCYTTALRSLD